MQTMDGFLEAKRLLETFQEYPKLKYYSLPVSPWPAGVYLEIDGKLGPGTAFPNIWINIAAGISCVVWMKTRATMATMELLELLLWLFVVSF